MRSSRRRPLGLASALVALVLAGCGGGDESDDASATGRGAGAQSTSSSAATTTQTSLAPPTTAAAGGGSSAEAEAVIVIENSAYTVKAPVPQGATVGVANEDDYPHTVTMDGGGGFRVALEGGSAAAFPADQPPGTYSFHCEIHPNMTGSLVIE